MLASHRSLGSLAPQSVVRVRPDAATKSSTASCSCQHSTRSKAIPHPVPTTIENEPKESATIKPSSPSLDADQTCSSRCSETAPSTNPGLLNLQQQLDENYRSTPPPGLVWRPSTTCYVTVDADSGAVVPAAMPAPDAWSHVSRGYSSGRYLSPSWPRFMRHPHPP